MAVSHLTVDVRWFRRECLRRGLNQTLLIERGHLDRSTCRRLDRGEPVSADSLIKLSALFETVAPDPRLDAVVGGLM